MRDLATPPPSPAGDAVLAELVARVAASHAPIRDALATVAAGRAHLAGAHGLDGAAALDALDVADACLVAHLAKAEQIALPIVRRVAAGWPRHDDRESLAAVRDVVHLEHLRALAASAGLIAALGRDLAAGPGTAACAPCTAIAIAGAALHAAVAQHADLEEHELYPRALAGETDARTSPSRTSRR